MERTLAIILCRITVSPYNNLSYGAVDFGGHPEPRVCVSDAWFPCRAGRHPLAASVLRTVRGWPTRLAQPQHRPHSPPKKSLPFGSPRICPHRSAIGGSELSWFPFLRSCPSSLASVVRSMLDRRVCHRQLPGRRHGQQHKEGRAHQFDGSLL